MISDLGDATADKKDPMPCPTPLFMERRLIYVDMDIRNECSYREPR